MSLHPPPSTDTIDECIKLICDPNMTKEKVAGWKKSNFYNIWNIIAIKLYKQTGNTCFSEKIFDEWESGYYSPFYEEVIGIYAYTQYRRTKGK